MKLLKNLAKLLMSINVSTIPITHYLPPKIEFLVNNEHENGYEMGFNLKLLTVEIENISVDESLEFQIMEQLEESLEKLKEIVSLD